MYMYVKITQNMYSASTLIYIYLYAYVHAYVCAHVYACTLRAHHSSHTYATSMLLRDRANMHYARVRKQLHHSHLCVGLSRDLYNNKITTLSEGVFQGLTSLQEL